MWAKLDIYVFITWVASHITKNKIKSNLVEIDDKCNNGNKKNMPMKLIPNELWFSENHHFYSPVFSTYKQMIFKIYINTLFNIADAKIGNMYGSIYSY